METITAVESQFCVKIQRLSDPENPVVIYDDALDVKMDFADIGPTLDKKEVLAAFAEFLTNRWRSQLDKNGMVGQRISRLVALQVMLQSKKVFDAVKKNSIAEFSSVNGSA